MRISVTDAYWVHTPEVVGATPASATITRVVYMATFRSNRGRRKEVKVKSSTKVSRCKGTLI